MNNGLLGGRVALITGASRGIGKAIALELGRHGARVFMTARGKTELEAAAGELRAQGIDATATVSDVGIPSACETAVADALERAGKIDILVNNAGIGVFRSVHDMTQAEFDAMWNTNVRGVFAMTRACLPAMMKHRSGAIVNIASLAGKNSFKGGAGYCATKWALRGFASSLLLEVREFGIRVVTIFPGSVETTFSPSGKKGPSITQAEDVAGAVLFALTTPERTMISEIDVRPTNPV